MSKTKVEIGEFEEEEEEYCDGKCEDDCLKCLFNEEKRDMDMFDRGTECYIELRKCMDDNYMCIGTKLSSNDVIEFVKKIK